MEAQILEDDQKELNKQRKKKEKQMQYIKDLKKQMQENEVKRRKAKEEEDAVTRYVQDYELNW